MTTQTVTLDHLERIAFESGGRLRITVDATRGLAYLRRGQVRYEAPLAPAPAPSSG